jgi:parallel beta-helix repeat protein
MKLMRQVAKVEAMNILRVWMVPIAAGLSMACNINPTLNPTANPKTDSQASSADSLEPSASKPLSLRLSESVLTRPALIKLNATTATGTKSVIFFKDGVQLAKISSAPFETQTVFAKVEKAKHLFSFEAFDAAGKSQTSAPAALNVNIAGKVRYVSPSGSDANDGLSETKPLPTIRSAVDLSEPGDTVLVMSGTYSQTQYPEGDIVTITKSGRAAAWIALMAYPGQKPKLKSINWQAVNIMASYILVQGFTIEGNRDSVTLEYAMSQMDNLNNPKTSGQGITVSALYPDRVVKPHHVIIRGNTIYKCPGSGIGTGNADYVTIEDNIVWGNAWYSPYGTSGISMYQNWNSDNSGGYKMIVHRNMVYENRNFIPFFQSDPDPAKRKITDGNGIIVDDSKNTQNGSPLGAYRGRTLIENNVVFNNGARGIHAFESEHIDIVNNTTRHNSFQAETPDGEITAFAAGDVRVYNNILVPRPDRVSIGRYGTTIAEKNSQVFKRNMVFGGLGFDADATQNLIGIDPLITDPGNKNFRPVADSPAVDAADSSLSAKDDFDRRLRPLGKAVDLGAFEVR